MPTRRTAVSGLGSPRSCSAMRPGALQKHVRTSGGRPWQPTPSLRELRSAKTPDHVRTSGGRTSAGTFGAAGEELQATRRVARRYASKVPRAQTTITSPIAMKTSVRPSGGRSRSVSSRRSAGGRTSASPGPATSAPPNARASSGSRLSPKNRVCANTRILSQGDRDRSRCYWCLVIRPRWTTQWDGWES